MIIMDEPLKNVDQKPAIILRWANIRGGMVAVFGLTTWTTTNPSKSTPASVSSAVMRPLPQA